MKIKEIFTPDVWRMTLTFVLIVGYFITNDFLNPSCQNFPECNGEYYYNSINFFGKHCGCITYHGFLIDLILYLFLQFLMPYILSCLILASRGYLTSAYGKSFKQKKSKNNL